MAGATGVGPRARVSWTREPHENAPIHPQAFAFHGLTRTDAVMYVEHLRITTSGSWLSSIVLYLARYSNLATGSEISTRPLPTDQQPKKKTNICDVKNASHWTRTN